MTWGLLPVCFLAGCIWIIVFELPKRLANADVGFIRACSFLFIRFRRLNRLVAAPLFMNLIVFGASELAEMIPVTDIKLLEAWLFV